MNKVITPVMFPTAHTGYSTASLILLNKESCDSCSIGVMKDGRHGSYRTLFPLPIDTSLFKATLLTIDRLAKIPFYVEMVGTYSFDAFTVQERKDTDEHRIVKVKFTPTKKKFSYRKAYDSSKIFNYVPTFCATGDVVVSTEHGEIMRTEVDVILSTLDIPITVDGKSPDDLTRDDLRLIAEQLNLGVNFLVKLPGEFKCFDAPPFKLPAHLAMTGVSITGLSVINRRSSILASIQADSGLNESVILNDEMWEHAYLDNNTPVRKLTASSTAGLTISPYPLHPRQKTDGYPLSFYLLGDKTKEPNVISQTNRDIVIYGVLYVSAIGFGDNMVTLILNRNEIVGGGVDQVFENRCVKLVITQSEYESLNINNDVHREMDPCYPPFRGITVEDAIYFALTFTP